jgi:putative DNA primase/helicase
MSTPADIDVARARRKTAQWRDGLITSDRGEPKRLIANVLHVLASHTAWDGVLVFDEFVSAVNKSRPPPTRAQDGTGSGTEWTEADTARTRAWFASEVGFEPSVSDVEQAVITVAHNRTVHPVRRYLRGLSWDGVPRIDGVLASYFGASATPYTRSVGPRWLISAVARVMRPGCQADCMVVLEGAQGAGKSTGLAALFTTAWFADTGIHIGDKDSYQALRGKWCYEFGELAAIKGRDIERVKSFVSARVDTYRPSYGRRTVDFSRQCVFAGTTNDSEYLADRTGNRRFWPVACGTVDVDALHRDRAHLWAEAVTRFDSGDAWHVDTPELRALCAEEQAEREMDDPWVSLIGEWIHREQIKGSTIATDGLTTARVLSDALSVRDAEMHRGLETRVGAALRRLGWEPRRLRREGGRDRFYFPVSLPSHEPPSFGWDGEHP